MYEINDVHIKQEDQIMKEYPFDGQMSFRFLQSVWVKRLKNSTNGWTEMRGVKLT